MSAQLWEPGLVPVFAVAMALQFSAWIVVAGVGPPLPRSELAAVWESPRLESDWVSVLAYWYQSGAGRQEPRRYRPPVLALARALGSAFRRVEA